MKGESLVGKTQHLAAVPISQNWGLEPKTPSHLAYTGPLYLRTCSSQFPTSKGEKSIIPLTFLEHLGCGFEVDRKLQTGIGSPAACEIKSLISS